MKLPTFGPWGWHALGGRLGLFAQYGSRKVVLTARKAEILTCDPNLEENVLIPGTGEEPDLRLIENAPLLLRQLCRAVLDKNEADKWWFDAEKVVAHALGFGPMYDRKALYAAMNELRPSWGNREPRLPSYASEERR